MEEEEEECCGSWSWQRKNTAKMMHMDVLSNFGPV